MAKNMPKELGKPEQGGILAPFEEMDHWFEDFFRRPFFGPPWLPRLKFAEPGEVCPAVDIFEEGDEVVIKAEVAGVTKENLDVNISGDVITISGEKKSEDKVDKKNYYRWERSIGSFSRRLRLPAETQPDKATASFKNGTLEVRIPKTKEAIAKGKKIHIT